MKKAKKNKKREKQTVTYEKVLANQADLVLIITERIKLGLYEEKYWKHVLKCSNDEFIKTLKECLKGFHK